MSVSDCGRPRSCLSRSHASHRSCDDCRGHLPAAPALARRRSTSRDRDPAVRSRRRDALLRLARPVGGTIARWWKVTPWRPDSHPSRLWSASIGRCRCGRSFPRFAPKASPLAFIPLVSQGAGDQEFMLYYPAPHTLDPEDLLWPTSSPRRWRSRSSAAGRKRGSPARSACTSRSTPASGGAGSQPSGGRVSGDALAGSPRRSTRFSAG
jgi:hypothetical protein